MYIHIHWYYVLLPYFGAHELLAPFSFFPSSPKICQVYFFHSSLHQLFDFSLCEVFSSLFHQNFSGYHSLMLLAMNTLQHLYIYICTRTVTSHNESTIVFHGYIIKMST